MHPFYLSINYCSCVVTASVVSTLEAGASVAVFSIISFSVVSGIAADSVIGISASGVASSGAVVAWLWVASFVLWVAFGCAACVLDLDDDLLV